MRAQFVNEAVGVEVAPGRSRESLPVAFVWRGRRWQVESWGRHGPKLLGDREVYCYLVQTGGPETWELCQEKKTAQWTLVRHWARRVAVA